MTREQELKIPFPLYLMGICNVQVWLRDRCNAMGGQSEEADAAEAPQGSPECLAGKVSASPSSMGCVAAPGACQGQLKCCKFGVFGSSPEAT